MMSVSFVSYVFLWIICCLRCEMCKPGASKRLLVSCSRPFLKFTFTKSTTLDPRACLFPLLQLKVVSVIYSLHGTWTSQVASKVMGTSLRWGKKSCNAFFSILKDWRGSSVGKASWSRVPQSATTELTWVWFPGVRGRIQSRAMLGE